MGVKEILLRKIIEEISQETILSQNICHKKLLRSNSRSRSWPDHGPQKSIAIQFSLRNLLIFNLSLSDLWLCLIAMPVTLTEIKVAVIVIVFVIEIIIPLSLSYTLALSLLFHCNYHCHQRQTRLSFDLSEDLQVLQPLLL